jgi:hypothetical protein
MTVKGFILVPDYFKLFARYLSNAHRSPFGERDFRYAIDVLADLPHELIFLAFNYNTIPTHLHYSSNGYEVFDYTLAHILKSAKPLFKVSKLSSEQLFKVITPILRQLEKSSQESLSINRKISLQIEILEIAKNALALTDVSQKDFYTRSMFRYVTRASRNIETLKKEREQQVRQKEAQLTRKPTLEEQKLNLQATLKDAFRGSLFSGNLIDLDKIKISYKKMHRHIEGQDVAIYAISYIKPEMSSYQPAYNLTWFLPEYQNGVFVLEQILSLNSDGWVLWDRNIPERIRSIHGLEVKPFGIKNVLLRLRSVSCAGYFQ